MKKAALIVDDDAAVRELLTDFLESIGFDAVAVESGEMALRLSKNLRPYLILLDIILPGESGVDVLQRIRTESPRSTVIMISGQTDLEIGKHAIELGAYDYCAKPLDLKFLKWLILDKLPRDRGES